MKTLIIILALLLTCAGSFTFAQTSQSNITNISAQLFYNQNKENFEKDVAGKFSVNLIENSDFSLWNTIIGEGSAEGYSNQTIVIVSVYSKGLTNIEQTLKLTVSSGGKILLKESKKFDCIGDDADYKILFLLNDTGCDELLLNADLINESKVVSTLSKTIDFKCGE